MSPYAAYLLETFVTLGAVCALAFFVLWGARRLGVARATGPVELRGHLALDARRAIYLVKVCDRVFVIGVGEGGFTKLGEVAASELPAPDVVRPAPFGEVLARILAKRDSGGDRGP